MTGGSLAPVMEAPVRETPKSSSATTEELHLLISELDDELSAYRWREAIWLSIVFHIVVGVAAIFSPKWWPKKVVVIPITRAHNQQSTFLEMPKDLLHVKPPKTDIISDKNRIAQTRTPVPDAETLRRILNAQRPGAPGRQTPPPTPPAPTQQAVQQQAPPANQQQGSANPAQQQPQQSTQTARVQAPTQAGSSANSPFKTGMAPGSAVQQAIQSIASGHSGATHVSFGGDYGPRHSQQKTNVHGDVDIMSDTMGVDFGPYMERVIYAVRTHWYNLIPESASAPLMKQGKLAIEFAILPNGTVAGLHIAISSGDDSLDRPAYGSITGSTPFQPLPSAFKGPYLQLRFKFYYNPDKNDLD